MKKIVALVLSLVLILSCASASARTVFDANREKIHFVVLTYDDETDETFTAVWTFKTVISRIAAAMPEAMYLVTDKPDADAIIKECENKNAVAVGCGLSVTAETKKLVEKIIEAKQKG